MPSFFLLPPEQNRGGGSEAPAAMGPRPGGATAAGVEGERGSGVRGFNSPAHLGLGRGEEAGQQEQAARRARPEEALGGRRWPSGVRGPAARAELDGGAGSGGAREQRERRSEEGKKKKEMEKRK